MAIFNTAFINNVRAKVADFMLETTIHTVIEVAPAAEVLIKNNPAADAHNYVADKKAA